MARFVLLGPAFPYRGGIAQFSDRLAEEMGRRHEIELITFSRQYPSFLFPGRSQFVDDLRTATRARPILDSINPFTWSSTGRQIAAFNPDALIISYWMPFMIPTYLTVMRSVKKHAARRNGTVPQVILLLHNLMPHERIPFSRQLTRYFLNRADGIVCLSESVRKLVLDLKPNARVLATFHPVYDVFHPPVPRREARDRLALGDRPVLLFFGLVRTYKGLDTLLRAMPAIKTHCGAQLVVAGEFYDDKDRYLSLAEKLGLTVGYHAQADIRFIDEYIPNDKVHLYFSAADVVVQPYHSATQSGVVQTAYYFGKPVIVTDVGGLAETVKHGETGLIVPPDDPAALAGAVADFFRSDPGRLAHGAGNHARRHTWSRLVGEMEAFISDGV